MNFFVAALLPGALRLVRGRRPDMGAAQVCPESSAGNEDACEMNRCAIGATDQGLRHDGI